MKNPRVIFAGTPEFALASLSALFESGVVPVGVLTQPDRPAGRGKRMTASPVKLFAEAHGIPVMQPTSLCNDEVVDRLTALKPDLMIVAAYGLILPQNVLDIPKQGCLNVHASILPRWRGAAPIQAAILAGDAFSGISLMSMTAGLDCGPVFVAKEIAIGAEETAGELHDRLAHIGGEILVANLDDILKQNIAATPQDEALVSYAGKIKKSDAQLDWSQPSVVLERRVRAYNPAPGAFFFAHGEDPTQSLRIKCWRAIALAEIDAAPGTVVGCGPDEVVVACVSGGLSLLKLQLPGKRSVRAHEFANQLDLSGQVLS